MQLTEMEKNVLWLRANEYSKKEVSIILKISYNDIDDLFKGIAKKIQTADDTVEIMKIMEVYS